MISLVITVVSILGIILGKYLFKKWFNHLSLYCFIWGGLILSYQLKLLPYSDIVPLTWFYIFSAFLSFLLGILTLFTARNLYLIKDSYSDTPNSFMKVFVDDGTTVKYALLIFSLIGLYAALQHWSILIDKFGSIPAVFLNANTLYVLNSQGGIKGQVPFISNFGYVAIFFAAIFTAYKGRFTFLSFLPFIGIILKELATVGRAGMLLALMEFLFTFFLFRHLLTSEKKQNFIFSKKNAIISFTILSVFFIASASLVRLSRGATENYSGTNRSLMKFEDNLILSPSIYLYISSHVGVLNKYSSSDGENTGFGQNTFLTAYHIFDKFGFLERPSDYQKGYFVPMWTNTGTYIRELHADFGLLGIYLVPYFFGLVITWLWLELKKKKSLIILTILVYLYLIVGFSFLVIITRTSYWSISQLLIILSIPIIEKIARIRFIRLKRS